MDIVFNTKYNYLRSGCHIQQKNKSFCLLPRSSEYVIIQITKQSVMVIQQIISKISPLLTLTPSRGQTKTGIKTKKS